MTILWDALAVGIILTFAFSAYQKGFLHTAVRLAGTVVAFGVSMIYSKPVAAVIYHSYLKNKLLSAVTQHLPADGPATMEAFAELASQFASQLPAIFSEQLTQRLGLQTEELYAAFSSGDAGNFSELMAASILEPLAVALLQAVVFCLMFGLLMLLVKAVAALVSTVNYLPLLGSINSLLGAVLGTIQGIVYLFVLCAMLWLVITATSNNLSFLNFELMQSTKLMKYFFSAGPWVDGFIKGF